MYFVFCTCTSRKKRLGWVILLSPYLYTKFSPQLTHFTYCATSLILLLLQDSALGYQQSRHNRFHLPFMYKSVTAKRLFSHPKHNNCAAKNFPGKSQSV